MNKPPCSDFRFKAGGSSFCTYRVGVDFHVPLNSLMLRKLTIVHVILVVEKLSFLASMDFFNSR